MSALLHVHPVPARALAALRPACVARLSASAVNNVRLHSRPAPARNAVELTKSVQNTPPVGREPDKRAFAVAFWAALGALLSTPVVAVRYHLCVSFVVCPFVGACVSGLLMSNDWCSVERSRGRLG
ncbi:hypothetical protein DFH11DRAFT_1630089 [Phellopilus nigrolimitatus]|nr:hypothetical protein DFH11DRAFT_1630089 [Phellopilus nigrolimitatus]